MNFVTTVANQRVAILFNAECAVQGIDRITYVDIDVAVDGVVSPPSNSDNALCTSDGSNTLSRWVSASTNVYRIVPVPGVHQLTVRATMRNFNAGDHFRLDDISVIVLK